VGCGRAKGGNRKANQECQEAGGIGLTMIKLFSVKQKHKEAAESANGRVSIKKQSAGELRLQKDISELNLAKTTSISFPNGKDNLLNFEITI
jgi:ubiquitin-conjugating enzyme E2 M